MKLIVGLGNPGPKYSGTRHNAGFWVVNRVAELMKVRLDRSKGDSVIGIGEIGSVEVVLAKPLTFMNRSGLAVKQLARAFSSEPLDILICYDDLAFPPGDVRLRAKGSAGGHNGMRSVIQYVGTDHFPRLRVGIGPVPPGVSGVEYVLGRPSPDERALLEHATERGAHAAMMWVEHGIDFAMSRANSNPRK